MKPQLKDCGYFCIKKANFENRWETRGICAILEAKKYRHMGVRFGSAGIPEDFLYALSVRFRWLRRQTGEPETDQGRKTEMAVQSPV
ncbi:MAG: hypothetical protein ACI4O8_05455 [Aristaeellaceae bacterium]